MHRPDASGARGGPLPVLLPLSAVPQAGFASVVALRQDPAWSVAVPSPAGATAYGLLGVAAVVAVLLLRRRPGPAVAAAGVLELAAVLLLPLPPLALLPLIVAVAWAVARGARWWAAGVVAALVLVPLTQLFLGDGAESAGRSLGTMLVLVLAYGAGAFRRARRVREEEERRRSADRQRIAVETERVRIARELHDVLAHSLSSISVQAGVGLHLAADRPEAATEALAVIRDASRGALDEVRGVLGLLRGDEQAPLTPGPGLDALPALVEEVRRSGARVELADRLPARPPQAVQLAAYRIVQESLTNARRHAPGAAIEVVLAQEGQDVLVSVRDRRPGAHPVAPHAGNGMTGMRERAAQLGGTLRTLLHDDGLEVAARLPTPGRDR